MTVYRCMISDSYAAFYECCVILTWHQLIICMLGDFCYHHFWSPTDRGHPSETICVAQYSKSVDNSKNIVNKWSVLWNECNTICVPLQVGIHCFLATYLCLCLYRWAFKWSNWVKTWLSHRSRLLFCLRICRWCGVADAFCSGAPGYFTHLWKFFGQIQSRV